MISLVVLRDTRAPQREKGKTIVHVDTSNLHYTSRSNKYDGFKVSPMEDGRISKSKVKPRVMPHITIQEENSASEMDVPPPTAIITMQDIGTHLCAIPEEELTASILLKEASGADSDHV
ncbi:hypothetical protein D1007_08067 [Hordeum vulgare]|nr:hypothetical protein D1007_08067 [Hordeum vulgare]